MNKILITAVMLAFVSAPALGFAQGVVKGKVVFEGTVPAIEKIDVKSDTDTCGNVKEVSKILVGADKGVANVVVKIVGAPGDLVPKDGALDQVKCEFLPHVQVIPLGSKLKITSDDAVLHNAHGFLEDGSTAFNIAVPIPGMEIPTVMKKPGVIKLRCDAGHTWMSGYIAVVETPFYAVTDANGNFSIENVPPGDYQVEIWQEWAGKQTQPISVKEGEQEVTYKLEPPAAA